ncbi:MAG: hypothetical protein ACYC2K_11840 [Gemmatimonadales bacterium]
MRRLSLLCTTPLAILVVACGGGDGGTDPTPPPPPPPPTPGALTAVSGQSQTVTVGQAVQVTVRVTTTGGAVVSGASVSFAIQSGGGSVSAASVTSDAQGQASASWTLGTVAGSNTLRATVGSVAPLDFTATGTAAAASTVAAHAGAGQQGTVSTALPVAPAVVVKDQFGNPVPNVPVVFAVAAGGGSVTGANPSTNAQGIAAVGSWTLGAAAGNQSLTATTGTLTPVTFSAAAAAGSAASMLVAQGAAQTVTVGTAVAQPPAVRVNDQFGNPVAGVTVTFAVTGGGGQVTGAAATTTAAGIATVGSWTLGTIAGPNGLSATAAGVPTPLSFSATGVAGPPTQVIVVTGSGQSARVGNTLPVRPTVRVRDQYQNPVANVPVSFAVTVGGGSVAAAAQVTGVDGLAQSGQWTLGLFSAAHQLAATVAGLPPAVFIGTGVSGWTYDATSTLALAAVFANEGANAGGTPWSATLLGSPPLLGIACSNSGIVLVSLYHDNLISASGAVAFSFDGGAGIGQIWDENIPEFNMLVYSGTNTQAKTFVATLALSRNFRIAFNDFRGPTYVASFDVRGLALELPRLMATCP